MKLFFRKGTTKDFPQIFDIAYSYYKTLNKDGFLVKLPDEKSLLDFVENQTKELYVACNEINQILGYLLIDSIINEKNSNKSEYYYFNEEDKLLLSDPEIRYINQIAVKKEFKHLKIGSFLYKNLLKDNQDKTYILAVVTGPVMNEASYYFHMKNGFEVIGTYQNDEYRGIRNYESVLFLKRGLKD